MDTQDLSQLYEFAGRAAERVRQAIGHDQLIALTVEEVEVVPAGTSAVYYIMWKARWSDGRRERLLIVYPRDYFNAQTEDYMLERAIQKLKRQLVKEDMEEFDAGVKM
jgi:hypothetical protein